MADTLSIVEVAPDSSPSTSVLSGAATAVVVAWRVVSWPVRTIVRLVTAAMLRAYLHYCVQANSKAKCPACGIRAEHDVRWAEQPGALVHVCKRCLAVWSESPIVNHERWRTTLAVAAEEDGSTLSKDGTRTTTIQHAQREPQVVTNFKPTGKDRPVILRIQQPGGSA